MASFKYAQRPVPTVRRRLALTDQLTKQKSGTNLIWAEHTSSHLGIRIAARTTTLVLLVIGSVIASIANGVGVSTTETETGCTFSLEERDTEERRIVIIYHLTKRPRRRIIDYGWVKNFGQT
jgi:hypothetical protein